MRFPPVGKLSAGLFLIACAPPRVSADGSATDTTDESETSTGDEFEPCTCARGGCDQASLNDCELPSPCASLDPSMPNTSVTTCILQLLADQEHPSQFDYGNSTGLSFVHGTFYILGPGMGIDLECRIVDDLTDFTPAVHEIKEPAYFQDCLGGLPRA